MRVFLVLPPLEARFNRIYVPIGLAYLKAYVVDRHPTKAFDMSGYGFKQVEECLAAEPFDVIGISCLSNTRASARKVASIARRINPGCRIVLGGAHPSSLPEQVLDVMGADAVVLGEGELTFRDLVDAYDENRDLSTVQGIVFRRNGEFVRTPSRPLIPDLDGMRWPDFSDFPPDEYGRCAFLGLKDTPMFRNGNVGNLFSSRGCPFKCEYCSTAAYWSRKARAMSPKQVVDQMEWLRKERGVSFILFMDDLFTTDRKRVIGICEEIIRRGVDIPWVADARVDTVDAEELRLMSRAHCYALYYGMESGSPAILKNINKEATLEETVEAIRATKAAGIHAWGFFMIGNPGESLATVRETFDLWLKMDPDGGAPGATLTAVYPDTGLYKLAKEKGIVTDDYWRTDGNAPIYTGDHWVITLRFYRFYLYALWVRHKIVHRPWKEKLEICLRSLRWLYWRVTGVSNENVT